jgi:hypothetical protein
LGEGIAFSRLQANIARQDQLCHHHRLVAGWQLSLGLTTKGQADLAKKSSPT